MIVKPKHLKKNEFIVVFRKEHNPYTERDQYVAIFPDQVSRRSWVTYITCQAFYEGQYGHTIWESTSDMSYEYYHKNTKRISKEELEWCRNKLQSMWDSYDLTPEDHCVVVPRLKMYYGRGC